jgi:protein-S-isoprenylcysteine O-methyltransferase Ste14
MGIGVSIFFIAVGAILTFAVSTTVSGISISTVGVILMLVGGLGLLWALIAMGTARRGGTTVVHDEF